MAPNEMTLSSLGTPVPELCGTGILPVHARAGNPCHTHYWDRFLALIWNVARAMSENDDARPVSTADRMTTAPAT